ncbi:hypothetical protein HanIR_Chr05g0243511 [Helianthus annuus]|nr:hypothetical protein HanIR_Chr05g0243511 [Helianthus annuus]
MNSRKHTWFTILHVFHPAFFPSSQKRYTGTERDGRKEMQKNAERERERERSGASKSPASGPTRACLPPTETKSSSLGFPARVPIKFWQFPVTSGEVPESWFILTDLWAFTHLRDACLPALPTPLSKSRREREGEGR